MKNWTQWLVSKKYMIIQHIFWFQVSFAEAWSTSMHICCRARHKVFAIGAIRIFTSPAVGCTSYVWYPMPAILCKTCLKSKKSLFATEYLWQMCVCVTNLWDLRNMAMNASCKQCNGRSMEIYESINNPQLAWPEHPDLGQRQGTLWLNSVLMAWMDS